MTEDIKPEQKADEPDVLKAGDKFERKEVTDFKNVKSRTFEFPFSSEYPVKRYFGNEVLSHDEGAADLSRLNDGGAVLFNHNMDKPIGVVESAYIGDCLLYTSPSPRDRG